MKIIVIASILAVAAARPGVIDAGWGGYAAPAVVAEPYVKSVVAQPAYVHAAPLVAKAASSYASFQQYTNHPVVAQPVVSHASVVAQPVVSHAPVVQQYYQSPVVHAAPVYSQHVVSQPYVQAPVYSQHFVSQPVVTQPVYQKYVTAGHGW